jgi:hypothetical protein
MQPLNFVMMKVDVQNLHQLLYTCTMKTKAFKNFRKDKFASHIPLHILKKKT